MEGVSRKRLYGQVGISNHSGGKEGHGHHLPRPSPNLELPERGDYYCYIKQLNLYYLEGAVCTGASCCPDGVSGI